MPTRTTAHPRDKWIPWYFVAFFLVLMLVDGVFVYIATSTNPGVVTEKAYIKGKDYNEVIAMADAQAARGWKGTATLEGNTLHFTLTDKDGTALSGAKVVALFRRPAEANRDFRVALMSRGDGRYSAEVKAPEPGLWDVILFATWNRQPFQMHERVRIIP